MIIGGLCEAVAARMPRSVAAPLLMLLWKRLRRTVARFAKLADQTLADRTLADQTAPRRIPVRRAGVVRADRPLVAGHRWPRGYAWLLRLVPEAASYGSQLQHLLAQPEMVALMAAVPQAGRMVRPLARMLAAQIGTEPGPKPRRVARPAKTRAVPVAWAPPPRAVEEDIPASGFMASGVPYWARNAWPGHDYAGREPPGHKPPGAVARERRVPARDRSGDG